MYGRDTDMDREKNNKNSPYISIWHVLTKHEIWKEQSELL